MRRSVVLPGSGRSGNDQLCVGGVDGQCPDNLLNLIVFSLKFTLYRAVGNRVIGGTFLCLASGRLQIRYFSLHELVAALCNCTVGEGFSIVFLAVRRGGKRHLPRKDGQRAVDPLDIGKLVRDILIVVQDFSSRHLVVSGFGVGYIRSRTGDDHTIERKAFRQSFYRIAAVCQRGSVIFFAAASGRDRNLRLVLGNGEGSLVPCNFIILCRKIRSRCIFNLVRHVSCFGNRSRRPDAVLLDLAVHKAVAADRDIRGCKSLPVILSGYRLGGQGNRPRRHADGSADGPNSAAVKIPGNIIAVGIPNDIGSNLVFHLALADVCHRAFHNSLDRIALSGFFRRPADGHTAVSGAVRGSVVHKRLGRCGNHQIHVGRCNRQFAHFLCDLIIILLESVVLRIRDRVVNRPHIGNASGRPDIRYLSLHKAVPGDCHRMIGQRCSVVRLRVRRGGKRHLPRKDGQRAVDQLDIRELIGDILTVVQDLSACHYIVSGCSVLYIGSRTGDRYVTDGKSCRQTFCLIIAVFKSCPVIDFFSAFRRDLNFRRVLANCQRSFIQPNVVVGRLEFICSRIGNGICTVTDFRLASGRFDVRHFSVHKRRVTGRHRRSRECCAIVLFFLRLRVQHHLSGIDLQGSVYFCNICKVSGNVSSGRICNRVGINGIIRCSGIRDASADNRSYHKVLESLRLGYGIAAFGKRHPVIGLFRAFRLDGKGGGRFRHLQRTILICNFIVAVLVIVSAYNFYRFIIRGSYRCLRTFSCNGFYFTINKLASSNRHIRRREGGSVIGHGCAGGCQSDGSWLNCQISVFHLYGNAVLFQIASGDGEISLCKPDVILFRVRPGCRLRLCFCLIQFQIPWKIGNRRPVYGDGRGITCYRIFLSVIGNA